MKHRLDLAEWASIVTLVVVFSVMLAGSVAWGLLLKDFLASGHHQFTIRFD
jgi:hypothetical protein